MYWCSVRGVYVSMGCMEGKESLMTNRTLRQITYGGIVVISFTAWYWIIKLIIYLWKGI